MRKSEEAIKNGEPFSTTANQYFEKIVEEVLHQPFVRFTPALESEMALIYTELRTGTLKQALVLV